MLFELKNAPSPSKVNQWHIEREYLNDFVITYLDDILIYSDDLEMHRSHVHKVLEKLNERALYVKKSKAGLKQRKLNS
jgi:hypothetical protein